MKKYILVIVAALFVSIGCEDTNENLVVDRDRVDPLMSDPSPAYFMADLETSYIQFDLTMPEGKTADKVEIWASLGSKVAFVKEVSLPAPGMKVTANEVTKALSVPASDYKTGDEYEIFVLTTKDGRVTRSQSTYCLVPVICDFDPADFVGPFYYASASWGEAGNVTITADPNNPYKLFIEGIADSQGLTSNGNKVEVNIKPSNLTVLSGPATVIASNMLEWGYTYTNYTYTPLSGRFNTCNGAFTISFSITVAQGSFGSFSHTFTPGAVEEPEDPDPEYDFSAKVSFTGRFTNPDGEDFALADVVLGADVDSVKVALINVNIKDAIEDGTIDDIIDDIDSGDIESVLLKKNGSVSIKCMEPDVYSFVVITYADEEVQEYAFVTFEFPPVYQGDISGSSVPIRKFVVRKMKAPLYLY